MDTERISSYIASLEHENSGKLAEVERLARETGIPVIRKEMESFLKVMITIKKPESILEIGTAIGYSALLMASAMPAGCTVTTIENHEERIREAEKNISGSDGRIILLRGDALDILPTLEKKFDFVFMDAAKAQYINYLPHVLRLMNADAILITDNILKNGDTIESRYAVERRDRTIHARVREYVSIVKNSPELMTSIVPIGDGITLSVKVG